MTAFPPVHTPDWQTSVCVQAFPALQLVAYGAFGLVHWPVEGLQVPAVWRGSDAAQMTAFPPVQTPDWQTSVWVQAFPSLQLVPFAAFGLVHWPVEGSQVPAVWRGSDAAQMTAFPPVHTPDWQTSVCVQAF